MITATTMTAKIAPTIAPAFAPPVSSSNSFVIFMLVKFFNESGRDSSGNLRSSKLVKKDLEPH